MFDAKSDLSKSNNREHRKLVAKLLSTAAAISLLSAPAQANPTGGTVVDGSATIGSVSPGSLLIDQGSNRAIIDWRDFSINAGEVTQFVVPDASSATLNRVTGGSLSAIYGTLLSNGQVYLINPNGVMIGSSGVIDTQGFLASTLDVDNDAFMSGGDLLFRGDSAASVVNLGRIDGGAGDVFLFAHKVENYGVINAGNHAGLAAGSEILLKGRDEGSGRVFVRAGEGQVTNAGTINAAVAELRAAGGNHYALAINNTGVIRATGAVRSGGRVYLTANSGRISHTGRIHARKSDGSGGKVEIRSGSTGGTGSSAINLGGQVDVRGETGRGGLVVADAQSIVLDGATIDASGVNGGGEVYIGGGMHGTDLIQTSWVLDGDATGAGEEIAVTPASSVEVTPNSSIIADSLEAGDGGRVVLWADGTMEFAASISAQALGESGNGGFAEVSGHDSLTFAGRADLRAANGTAGTLLLDPTDFTICNGADATCVPAANVLADNAIAAQLGLGNMTIATASGGGDAGDVTFGEGVNIAWSNESTLTVNADHDIIALNDVHIQHSGDGDDDNGGGIVMLAGHDITIGGAARVDTNGDDITGVAIGSEHGSNIFIAGVSGFGDYIPDQAGSVNVTGGDVDGAYAQLGYVMGTTRHDDEANGNIIVRAGSDVNLTGGGNLTGLPTGALANGAFAQIGHGGVNFVDAPFSKPSPARPTSSAISK